MHLYLAEPWIMHFWLTVQHAEKIHWMLPSHCLASFPQAWPNKGEHRSQGIPALRHWNIAHICRICRQQQLSAEQTMSNYFLFKEACFFLGFRFFFFSWFQRIGSIVMLSCIQFISRTDSVMGRKWNFTSVYLTVTYEKVYKVTKKGVRPQ